jgi:hypothetical protein
LHPSPLSRLSSRLDKILEFDIRSQEDEESKAAKALRYGLLYPAAGLLLARQGVKAHRLIRSSGGYKNVGNKFLAGVKRGWTGKSELSSRLDKIIEFDDRPRDPMGQFVNQDDTGPNPNDMAKVYRANRTGIAEGAGATIAGVAAGPLVKALMQRIRKPKA